MILANQGRYDLDSQKVDVNGPVRVVGPDGSGSRRAMSASTSRAASWQARGRSRVRCGSASQAGKLQADWEAGLSCWAAGLA